MKIINTSVFVLSLMMLLMSNAWAAKNTTVYVATNKADANTIVAYKKTAKGKFTKLGEYKTGGKGTGDLEVPSLKKDSTHPLANGDDPLISAYGIVASADKKHMLAVNAGDASVSLMAVKKDGSLKAINSASTTTEKFPISVAVNGNNVIVASVGESNGHGSIQAFVIKDGKLQAVADSRRDLNARPSTIMFSSDGKFVIVSELVTGKIKSFALTGDTLSAAPVSTIDSPRAETRFQAIPVGFDIHKTAAGDIISMSEARFLTPKFGLREEANRVPQSPKYSWQTGSLSTYKLDDKGQLTLVSGDVLTGGAIESGEIANCWIETSHDGKTLWAANALSSSISSFSVDANGKATLKNVTAYKDSAELLFFSDLALDAAGKQLFQLVGNKGQVMVFDVAENGDLKLNQTVGEMPELGTFGLIVLN